jgi:hypothetical protein
MIQLKYGGVFVPITHIWGCSSGCASRSLRVRTAFSSGEYAKNRPGCGQRHPRNTNARKGLASSLNLFVLMKVDWTSIFQRSGRESPNSSDFGFPRCASAMIRVFSPIHMGVCSSPLQPCYPLLHSKSEGTTLSSSFLCCLSFYHFLHACRHHITRPLFCPAS